MIKMVYPLDFIQRIERRWAVQLARANTCQRLEPVEMNECASESNVTEPDQLHQAASAR
jgi:hypothetical protein